MNNSKTIWFATSNEAKIQQFQYVCDKLNSGFVVKSVYKNFNIPKYEENGISALDIAVKGAVFLFEKIKVPLVTEDSILIVQNLNNEPGLFSNKYLKEKGRTGLIDELRGTENRAAKIISAAAFIDENKIVYPFITSILGNISENERWNPGPGWVTPNGKKDSDDYNHFGGGFNAIFQPFGSILTLAEMTADDHFIYGYREPNFIEIIKFLAMKNEKR
ncbi:MAG: hypothetical protein J4473_00115 [Candidatus Aenigmarchaeota archaeon]|nr:hypothetical protein [Candidatus Aenigmarchaeota archaeon]